MENKINQRQIVGFFSLTFIISWGCWLLLPRITDIPQHIILMLGTFGPSTVGLILALVTDSFQGFTRLLKKAFIWRVGIQWYLVSFVGAAVIILIALFLHQLNGGVVIQLNDPRQWYLIFPGFLQVLFFSVIGEEFGWRGFALPRLLKQFNPLVSSIILGLLWGVWHLPLWWMPGNFHSQIPLLLFILHDVALSILMTWIYQNTKGSLLIALIFHTSVNLTIGVSPILPEGTGGSLLPLWYAFGLLWCCTAFVVVRNGKNLRKEAVGMKES
ncbi:MAG: CPBP family intramembrane glutamic endopeptidase [Anaerolineae bacterium]|jgi:membrane protease YdiL (CAAX protease family)|nr:CPBP family intramembrane glutamic endopeptidase [Anaerolineae bacterium]